MNKIYQGIKLSFSFLTIFPVKSEYNKENMRNSLYGYPIVGLCIGIIMTLISIILLKYINRYLLLIPIIIFIVENILTNFLHIDGLCDCIDALYFTKKGKDKLNILKDPHIGTYSVVWLIIFILLKIIGYYYLIKYNNIHFFILIPIAGYIVVPYQILSLTPMFNEGLGHSLKKAVIDKHLIFASIFFVVLSLIIAGLLKTIFLIILIFGSMKSLNNYFKEKFSGYNGDTIGFSIEIIKIVILFALIF